VPAVVSVDSEVTNLMVAPGRTVPAHWTSRSDSPSGTPRRRAGVYCPREEGTCCNKRIKQNPGTSNGLVRPFRSWTNPVILPQLSTAVAAVGGSAPSMPRMRLGTPVSLSRATKGARLSFAKRKRQRKARLYDCWFHKSEKRLTLAGSYPANNAASRFMPNPPMSSTPFPLHSCLSTRTDV
jgi:hypothetical protein